VLPVLSAVVKMTRFLLGAIAGKLPAASFFASVPSRLAI
jgi:hypothetical protein